MSEEAAMTVLDVRSSTKNRGQNSIIFMAVHVKGEVEILPEQLVMMLKEFASDDLAKLVNALGQHTSTYWNTWAFAQNDLDEFGHAFIEGLSQKEGPP